MTEKKLNYPTAEIVEKIINEIFARYPSNVDTQSDSKKFKEKKK